MNSELLREREAFKRKAMAVPVVESRPSASSSSAGPPPPKSHKKLEKKKELGAQSLSAQSKLDMAQMKQLGGQSAGTHYCRL